MNNPTNFVDPTGHSGVMEDYLYQLSMRRGTPYSPPDNDIASPEDEEEKEEEESYANYNNIKNIYPDGPPQLDEGEMHFVEHQAFIGPFVKGSVTLFDEDKYCEYTYSGLSGAASLIPADSVFINGTVENVYNPEDFSGWFINATGAIMINGISVSEGRKSDGTYVKSKSVQVVTTISGYIAGCSIQYFSPESADWEYGTAPIEWRMDQFNPMGGMA